MRSKLVVAFLLAINLHFIEGERNIIPSPVVCGKLINEEFVIDLGRCQNTCEYYGRTWDCPTSYKPKGDCYCKPGFARFTEDGECVSVTKNATCVAKLPIQPGSCNGPNEMYTENLQMGVCDKNCRTFGCQMPSAATVKWGPNCVCGNNDEHNSFKIKTDAFKRLSNGTCVVISDPKCIAEFQPSPERCAALGQIYTVNATCQQGCYGEQYCPPPGPACVCPPNKLPLIVTVYYYTSVKNQYGPNPQDVRYSSNRNPTGVLACYNTVDSCPETLMAGIAGR